MILKASPFQIPPSSISRVRVLHFRFLVRLFYIGCRIRIFLMSSGTNGQPEIAPFLYLLFCFMFLHFGCFPFYLSRNKTRRVRNMNSGSQILDDEQRGLFL